MRNLLKQNHPKGLYLLFCVEMWERFSFYGMRALIVLYMVQKLLYTTEEAGNIYGWYTGLVYLTPLLGGYLADRFFGQRKCIATGAFLMIIGLFLLAFGPQNLFLISLFLMVIANGLFKSNISSVLGLLYGNDNSKKDSAFTIFYMGINLGAFFSPLVCGTLAVHYGYEYGFAAAGCGMLFGLILYKIYEQKLLGDCGSLPSFKNKTDDINTIESTTSSQSKQLASLLILMIFTIPFWICFEQAGSSLTLFAEYNTNRNFFNLEIPTGYFQSLNPLFIIIFAPLMSTLWGYLRNKSKEPTSVEKFSIALFLIAIAFVILAWAGHISQTHLVNPLWLVLGYFIMTIAELCLSPIGLSLVTKLAPKKFLSLIMGCWFLTSFLGNLIAGFWGGKFEVLTPTQLFGGLAILSFITWLILICFMPRLNKHVKN